MASKSRHTPPAVNTEDKTALTRFLSEPWRFDIWQACAILAAAPNTADKTNNTRMDWGVPAASDFPTGPVSGVALREGEPPRLHVNLPGIAGLDGPLPPWIADMVRERSRAGDTAFQDFLDLFHNRMLKLWHSTATDLCPELRADCSAAEHPFALLLDAISGLSGTGDRQRNMPMPGPISGTGSVPAELFRSHAALWGMGPRSAAGLEKLIQAAFGIQARVEPFRGAWAHLPHENLTRLGEQARGNATLGESALLGHKIFDASAGITLHLGPLTEVQYRSFVPPPAGKRRADLLALVRWYLGEVECEIVLSGKKHVQHP